MPVSRYIIRSGGRLALALAATVVVAEHADASLGQISSQASRYTSWSHGFEVDLRSDRLMMDRVVLSAAERSPSAFAAPFVSSHNDGWQMSTRFSADKVMLSGDATDQLKFTLHFAGDPGTEAGFYLTGYRNGRAVENVAVRWDGSQWTYSSPSMRGSASAVPEPATLVLSGIGAALIAGGAIRRRMRSA